MASEGVYDASHRCLCSVSWYNRSKVEVMVSMVFGNDVYRTELGHGSNVRGLQTTAEYDPSSNEFVLNTPTLASMKWWPSSMATATHAVVYAQLLIKGKEYGVHVFWVQLRDENLEPLPGIEVGDIGTKAGENEVDIGYLRMKNVRIPRKHLMEKKSHVEPDGTYVKHNTGGNGDDKSHYLTMMTARVSMVAGESVQVHFLNTRFKLMRDLNRRVDLPCERSDHCCTLQRSSQARVQGYIGRPVVQGPREPDHRLQDEPIRRIARTLACVRHPHYVELAH